MVAGGDGSHMQQVSVQSTQPEDSSLALLRLRGLFINPCQTVG